MITVLVLASSPLDQDQLRLGKESELIKHTLERSRNRDQYRVVSCMAATADDLRSYILEYGPTIVHFCGHGAGKAGLCLEDSDGYTQVVSSLSLARLFHLVGEQVKCVVLNACYSEEQGHPISEHIDFVIGMRDDVEDAVALKFAEGFYQAIWAGQSFEKAFKFGCSAIDTAGLPNEEMPVLLQGPRLSGLSFPSDERIQKVRKSSREDSVVASENLTSIKSLRLEPVKAAEKPREWLWLEDEEDTISDIRSVVEREIPIRIFGNIQGLTRYLMEVRYSRRIGLILDCMIRDAVFVVRPSQSHGALPEGMFYTNNGYDAGLVYYEKIILGDRGAEGGLVQPPPPVIFCSVIHQEFAEILPRLLDIKKRWSGYHGVSIAEAMVMFVRKWDLSGESMLDLIKKVDI